MEHARKLIVTTGSNGAPLFATRETAESTAAAIKALDAAQTWGQFLQALPPRLADQVRKSFENDDLPEDHAEFDPSDVPGFEDGDFPTSINSTMLHELPVQVIERFGRKADTTLNGPIVEFAAGDLKAIVAALRDAGCEVIERRGLVLELQ